MEARSGRFLVAVRGGVLPNASPALAVEKPGVPS